MLAPSAACSRWRGLPSCPCRHEGTSSTWLTDELHSRRRPRRNRPARPREVVLSLVTTLRRVARSLVDKSTKRLTMSAPYSQERILAGLDRMADGAASRFFKPA